MLRYLPLTAFLVAFSLAADDATPYQHQQALKVDALDRLQAKFPKANGEYRLDDYGRVLRNGGVITDELVTERLDRDPDMVLNMLGSKYGVMSPQGNHGNAFRTSKGVTDQTVPPEVGAQEADSLGVNIPPPIKAERLHEVSGCKGELNDGLQLSLVAKCFTSLSSAALLITPYASIDKTYTRGLASLSSLVTTTDTHRCDVSVIKEGLWVTAKHCLDDVSWNVSILRIIVANKRVKITKAVAAVCKHAPCDIAFLYAETPASVELPTLLDEGAQITWDNPIFVPGLPYGATLAGVFEPESPYSNEPVSAVHAKLRYNDLVMWSPYNKGYCMSLVKDAANCIIHTCSTVRGFSGAPLYRYDPTTDKIVLVGIHSGANSTLNECTVTRAKVNYAKLITAGDLPK